MIACGTLRFGLKVDMHLGVEHAPAKAFFRSPIKPSERRTVAESWSSTVLGLCRNLMSRISFGVATYENREKNAWVFSSGCGNISTRWAWSMCWVSGRVKSNRTNACWGEAEPREAVQ